MDSVSAHTSNTISLPIRSKRPQNSSVNIKQENEEPTNTSNTSNTMPSVTASTDADHKVVIKKEEEQAVAELLAALPQHKPSKLTTPEKVHLGKSPQGNDKNSPLQVTLNPARIRKNKKWDRTPALIRLVRRQKIVHISYRGEVKGHVRLATDEWTLDESWREEAQARWRSSESK